MDQRAFVNVNRNLINRVIVSVDWGFINPGVFQVWITDSDDRMYLVHEIYQTRRLIGWWEDRAKELQQHYRPEVFTCDPSEPAYIAQLKGAGCRARPANNKVVPGIQAVAERLKVAPDGRPRLFLFKGARVTQDQSLVKQGKPTSTAEEFSSYIWQTGVDSVPSKEEPAKENDHGMDAVRYAVAYLDRPVKPKAKSWEY